MSGAQGAVSDTESLSGLVVTALHYERFPGGITSYVSKTGGPDDGIHRAGACRGLPVE